MDTLEQLAQRFVDDRQGLSEGELDALIAGMRADPARAAALYEQLLLDDLVSQKLAVDRRNFPAQVEQRITDYQRGQAEMDSHVAELRAIAESEIERPSTAAERHAPWIKLLLGLAAAGLVAAVLLVPRLAKRPVQLATLSNVQGEVQVVENGQPRSIGSDSVLYAGQTLQVPAGAAVTLTYADQTTLTLDDDAEARFELVQAAKQVHLARGGLSASIQPQSIGMVFLTPHARAAVLGTQLRLSVTATETQLEVSEGKVQFDRHSAAGEPTGKAKLVQGGETAIASPELFDVHPLHWPPKREALALLVSSVETRNGGPLMAARNPDSGNLRDAPLIAHSEAAIDEVTHAFRLSGGYFASDEAGQDAARAVSGKEAITVECVLRPSDLDDASSGQIASVADNSGFAFLEVRQEGRKVTFLLCPSPGQSPAGLSVELANASEPQHVAFSYSGDDVSAYLDGAEVARLPYRGGSIRWPSCKLTLGADPTGQRPWRGVLEGLAIRTQAVDAAEAARSARNHRVLAGRGI